MNSILILDDEREICESIKMILEYEDYIVRYSTNPEEGIKLLETGNYDAMLLDIQMPGINGFEILQKINEKKIDITAIIISAFSNLENAVKATKMGAFDFIEKPIDRDKLLISVRNAVSKTGLIKENKKLKEEIVQSEIIGSSAPLKSILDTALRVAPTDARILITGENGTGKELIARAIHRQSKRADKELVEVNCAAIPNELIESELFGHEKGAFTGATNSRIGKFEQANGGTLFLDEIGDMSLNAQAKVLRAIEDSKIEKVGSNKKIEVDVRIITATNKDLKEEIENGNFREDLYHRLNVIPIHVPSLRERKEDIPQLIEHFSNEICRKNKFTNKLFTKEAIESLSKLEWRGNVRELKNFIERIVIMNPKTEIDAEDIYSLLPTNDKKMDSILDVSNSFQDFKEKAERAFIKKQLDANSWNISKTAEALEIQRSHLYGKIKKYQLEKGNE